MKAGCARVQFVAATGFACVLLGSIDPGGCSSILPGHARELASAGFPLTAFMFLSACPVFPGFVYLTFFAEHRLPFDVVAGTCFVLLLIAECITGYVVLRELLRQEAARFLKMRELSDITTSEGDEERVRFLPGEDRAPMARSWQ